MILKKNQSRAYLADDVEHALVDVGVGVEHLAVEALGDDGDEPRQVGVVGAQQRRMVGLDQVAKVGVHVRRLVLSTRPLSSSRPLLIVTYRHLRPAPQHPSLVLPIFMAFHLSFSGFYLAYCLVLPFSISFFKRS